MVNDPTESAAILYAQAKLDHFLGDHASALHNAIRSAQLYTAMGDRKATAIVNHIISHIHLAATIRPRLKPRPTTGLTLARALDDDDLIELFQNQLDRIKPIRIPLNCLG